MRDVNERIRDIAAEAENPEFLCECANMDCTETIQASVAEYEAIRSSPVRFPVKSGHSQSEFERVVEEHEDYVVVEKFGDAGEVARKLDPRQRAEPSGSEG
jgi:hypothetical protein